MPLEILIDFGCSNHTMDTRLLPNIEGEMFDHVKFDPPMSILAAGGDLLYFTGEGILHSLVTDVEGNQRSICFRSSLFQG